MAGGGGGIQPLGQPAIQQQPALGAPNFFTGGTPLLGQGGNGWTPQPQPEVSNDPVGAQQRPLWQTRQMDRTSPFYNPRATLDRPIMGPQQPAPLWQTRMNDPNSPFYKPKLGGFQG